jgi:hypothetical protein
MTDDEIVEKLKRAFPEPDYGVGKWDYDRQFRIMRINDGRQVKGWFDHVRDTQNLDTVIKDCCDYFAVVEIIVLPMLPNP